MCVGSVGVKGGIAHIGQVLVALHASVDVAAHVPVGSWKQPAQKHVVCDVAAFADFSLFGTLTL